MVTDASESETERLATSVGLYVLGEISLGKAAERIGVDRWEMIEVLEDHGIEPRLGPADMDDAMAEVETLRDTE